MIPHFSRGLFVPTLALAALLLTAGCDRPFVAISNPESVVVLPDLTVAQIEPDILLKVASTSFRSVVRVKVNGSDMSRVSGDELWELPVTLSPGINLLLIEAFDQEDRLGVDSTYAIHLGYDLAQSNASLPIGTGGHAATLLEDGSVYISGGSSNMSTDATGSTIRYRSDTDAIEASTPSLLTARVGHTATNLGNDLILIVGGGIRPEISDVAELVQSAELYSHATQEIKEIPVTGPPIRRMYHTATFRTSSQGPILDLIGGTGDVQYTPEPLLSIRPDIRSFLLRNDSLIALSPAIGPYIEQLTGHIQVALTDNSPGEPAAFLVSGVGGIPPGGPIGLLVDFTTNLGILVDPVVQTFSTRSFHASAKLSTEFVGMFGGINWPDGNTISTAELYVHNIGQTFSLPSVSEVNFMPRFSHSATTLPNGQVILLGGFDAAGAGVSLITSFAYSVNR